MIFSLEGVWLTRGLYYKPKTIVNDDSNVVNKLEASLTEDARVVIYDCHIFIVKATEYASTNLLFPDSNALKGLERKVNIGFSIRTFWELIRNYNS